LANEHATRKSEFQALLERKDAYYGSAFRRLEAIVETGETSPKRYNIEFEPLFNEFIVHHPEWGIGNNVFVAFRDHPDLKGI
jgi:hypothetical protein